jgi:8-amino-7-oxononanoate synthase
MKLNETYLNYISERHASKTWRQLKDIKILPHGRAEQGGKTFINFASNDYLGLSQHPALIERAKDYTQKYGAGSTASRLVCGNSPQYSAIESKLAAGKCAETALIFNSGYQANLTVLAALADADVVQNPIILADRLAHNSVLQGGVLSGARMTRFHHNDYDHLDTRLKKYAADNAHIIIVTESVFGMDGDCADLSVLAKLAAQYNAMLYVDEAHATGLFGPDGFGFCAAHAGKIDIAMGTCGKALGGFGAYIACSNALRDYLIQRCGGLIYSTALPPAALGALDAALDLLPTLQPQRDYVQSEAKRVRVALTQQGWNCGHSTTHIIPVLLSSEDGALKLSDHLRDQGIMAPAIRPPTVPRGTSRLRLSLSAAHSHAEIDRLISVMAGQADHYVRAA